MEIQEQRADALVNASGWPAEDNNDHGKRAHFA